MNYKNNLKSKKIGLNFNSDNQVFSRFTVKKLEKIAKITKQKIIEMKNFSFEEKQIDSMISRIQISLNSNGFFIKGKVNEYIKIIFDDYKKIKKENILNQNLLNELQIKFDLLVEEYDSLMRTYNETKLNYHKLKKSCSKTKSKIFRLKNNKIKLLKHKICHIKNKNEINIKQINPFLSELLDLQIKQKNRGRYSEDLFKVSFLFSNNSSLYDKIIRYFLPLPSKRQIYNHSNNLIQETHINLFDINKLKETLDSLKINNVIPAEIFEINIGVDAMAFETFSPNSRSKKIIQYFNDKEIDKYSKILNLHMQKQSKNINSLEIDLEQISFPIDSLNDNLYTSVFAFLAMPLNPNIPVFPLLFIPKENGKADNDILQVLQKIIFVCENENIRVKYIISDGDNAYDSQHVSVFNRYKEKIFSDTDEIFNTITEYNLWIISDLLHILKIARNRLKNSIFLFNNSILYNANDINMILNLGIPLQDFSPNGKLKDSYPFAVFTLNNFIKLYENI